MITDTKYIIRKTNILELALSIYSHFECRKEILASNDVVQNKDSTIKLYTNIVSGKMLELAIKIRILLYQGYKFNPDKRYILRGTYEEITGRNEKNSWEFKSFSIKDICDKIIHAEHILIVSGMDSKKQFVLRDDIEMLGNKKDKGKKIPWLMHLEPNSLYEYLATCFED